MKPSCERLNLHEVRVFPLRERQSQAQIDNLVIDPRRSPPPCSDRLAAHVDRCAEAIRVARRRGATVSLIYGAHLIKNGAALIVRDLIAGNWITHLATNGAGTIHDWEFAFQGESTESVRDNVAAGCFGTWEETGKYHALALLTGNLRDDGYGASLGRLIHDEQIVIPAEQELLQQITQHPTDPLTAARAELQQAIQQHQLREGVWSIAHPWKSTSLLHAAFLANIPLTVHPGIGYDIIATHPLYPGAAIGRAASVDFARFGHAVEQLDQGVVLSVGSAIMGPQVFEKSLSCVNNLRLTQGRSIVSEHSIYVVDLQDGGNWDWTLGEPPATNPAYYLRFCKSYARMGGRMQYLCCDNVLFVHQLHARLCT